MNSFYRFWISLLIFILNFFFVSESIAQQQENSDSSLLREFKKYNDSVYFYIENDLTKVDIFYPKLVAIGKKLKPDYLHAEFLRTQAYYYRLKNQKDSAVLTLKKIIDILSPYPKDSLKEISVLTKTYNLLATIYLEANLYNQAIINQYKSVLLAELIHQKFPKDEDNNHYLSWAYSDLALIYSYTDDKKKSQNYFLKSISFSNKNCSAYNHSINQFNYGVFLLDIDEIDSAKYYFEKSLANFKVKSDLSEMIAVKLNLAKVYILKNEFEVAEQLCNEAIDESSKLGFNYYKAQGFLIISDLFLKNNQL
ncbi:MAG: hypothetical protein JXR34_03710, partial [Bacteroidales bacterium]|nr:hypothetical protein [Bacteroidales bacterium]